MTAFCIGAAIFSVSVLNTPRQRRYETRMQCRSSDHPCEACPVLDTGVGRVPPPARGEPVEPCEQVGERAYTYRGGMDSCFRRNGCGQRRDAALTSFLTTPAKAGVYRSWPFDKLRACPVLDTGVSRAPPPARGEPVEPCERVGERAYTYRGGRGDGFLLSQEWLRAEAGRGTHVLLDHPCESRGLPFVALRQAQSLPCT